MHRVLKFLDDHFEEVIIFLTLALMSLIIAFQVLMRYVFQASLSWSEEIARYLFIWLIYVGISYGAKKHAHVAVTATDLILSSKQQKVLKLMSDIVFLVFAALVTYYGYQVASRIGMLGQQSPAMDIPMWMVYSAVPVGFGLSCFRLIQRIYRQFTNREARDPGKNPNENSNDEPILL